MSFPEWQMNYVPQKIYTFLTLSITMNEILFGNKGFAGIIKDLKMKSS
jgi:hypothetical protein